MTVPSSKNRKDHVIASATTDYDYDFRIFANSNLVVISRSSAGVETTLVLDTDYTVAGAGDQNGGTITLSAAYLAAHDGEALAIMRVIPTTQNTSIRNQGKFYPETHEDVFDRLAMVDMQLDEESGRTVRMSVTVSSDMFDPTLPGGLVGSAGMTVIVNEDGDGFDVGPTATQISSAQSAATAAIAAKDDAISAATDASDAAEASEASALRSEAAALAAEAVGDMATQVHAAAEKTTPVNDDEFGLVDSAASNVLKRFKWSSLVTAVTSALSSDIIGTVWFFAASTAPTGFLKANGALVSRTAYASLFAAIGTTFGAGDGSTTFALPDLRGEFIRGLDDGRGVDSGRALGTAQADELKSHTHTGVVKGGMEWNLGNTASYLDVGNSGATGGTETRPRNIALLACIKY